MHNGFIPSFEVENHTHTPSLILRLIDRPHGWNTVDMDGVYQQPTIQLINPRSFLSHHTTLHVLLKIFNKQLLSKSFKQRMFWKYPLRILEPTFSHHFMRKLYLHKDVKRLCKPIWKKISLPRKSYLGPPLVVEARRRDVALKKLPTLKVRFWESRSSRLLDLPFV